MSDELEDLREKYEKLKLELDKRVNELSALLIKYDVKRSEDFGRLLREIERLVKKNL